MDPLRGQGVGEFLIAGAGRRDGGDRQERGEAGKYGGKIAGEILIGEA
jgi:hypothetical protein